LAVFPGTFLRRFEWFSLVSMPDGRRLARGALRRLLLAPHRSPPVNDWARYRRLAVECIDGESSSFQPSLTQKGEQAGFLGQKGAIKM